MMTKILSLGGRLRMAAACPDANAPLLAEAADAIEQHEVFKQEVSDVVYRSLMSIAKNCVADAAGDLSSFIIPKPKPDPLVEAWIEATGNTVGMEPLNAALEARGLEIRERGQ